MDLDKDENSSKIGEKEHVKPRATLVVNVAG